MSETASPATIEHKRAERAESDNPKKRSALWFLSVLLISYVPGLHIDHIQGISVQDSALDILRLMLWVASTYYCGGFALDWIALRTRNAEALKSTDILVGLDDAIRHLDVADDLRRIAAAAMAQGREALSLMANVEPELRAPSYAADTLAGEISGYIRALLIQKGDIPSNQAWDAELQLGVRNSADLVLKRFDPVARDWAAKCAQRDQAFIQIARVTDTLSDNTERHIERLERGITELQSMRRLIRRMSAWDGLRDDIWDFGGLIVAWAIPTVLVCGTVAFWLPRI